jgi:hypothetical protein
MAEFLILLALFHAEAPSAYKWKGIISKAVKQKDNISQSF